jgi:4-alpha-glucanotransferase
MGLRRLYWIPAASEARNGSYVRYPLRSMLAGLGTLSRRFRAIVVGEDLGTVPAGFREEMRDADIQSYRVFYFERREDRQFINPANYPRRALACLTTHDLPTLNGWWLGHDIAARSGIGIYTSDESARAREERVQDRRRLLDALSEAGLADDAMRQAGSDRTAPESPEGLTLAVHRYLAQAPSRLFAVQLEDIFGMKDQANLPGTQTEHPNWRRKLPLDIASIATDPSFRTMTAAMSCHRPRPSV